MLRALTRMSALRCAAVLLIAVALGTELDLRAFAARLQDATTAQAAIRHCGARSPTPSRQPDGSAPHAGGDALLAAALSLPAPLIIEPPAMASPAAFVAADRTGHILAWALPPPFPRAHRSRAPPTRA